MSNARMSTSVIAGLASAFSVFVQSLQTPQQQFESLHASMHRPAAPTRGRPGAKLAKKAEKRRIGITNRGY